jgi:hypothetical protein
MNESNTDKKWYNKTWLVVLSCLVFFPIGLFALWKNEVMSKNVKIGLTALTVVFVLALMGSQNNPTNPESTPQVDSAVTESSENLTENEASTFISGLTPADVYLSFENNGFKTEKKLDAEYGSRWISTQSVDGIDFEVVTFSTNATQVVSVRATAMIDVTQKDISAALAFVKYAASLTYENANPQEASKWVTDNFNNDKAMIVIGDAKFTIFAPSKAVRSLLIEKVM